MTDISYKSIHWKYPSRFDSDFLFLQDTPTLSNKIIALLKRATVFSAKFPDLLPKNLSKFRESLSRPGLAPKFDPTWMRVLSALGYGAPACFGGRSVATAVEAGRDAN